MSEVAKNFLEQLKEVNKKQSLFIYLPSVKRKVKFLPFTLKQQKNILAKLPDDASGLITFNNIFNDIITENAGEPIDLNSLNVFDRLTIVLSYRNNSIGENVNIDSTNVDVNVVIKNISEYDFQDKFESQTIKTEDISATVQIPSLIYDSDINRQITKHFNKNSTQQEILSELFISEVLKYIQTITINDSTVKLVDLEYKAKIEIIEQLPGDFVKAILSFIESIKTIENELTTVNGVKVELNSELFS